MDTAGDFVASITGVPLSGSVLVHTQTCNSHKPSIISQLGWIAENGKHKAEKRMKAQLGKVTRYEE